ncbi:RINT1-like protein MAG2L isoform X1 [Alnus glutinosa]|uniref:RINT1-like protein MAG2L isoform X1 n=1 Tax=Alnus glutinosa TaxID=3517 RepID=UPI002D782627|nr:RINT1-like protein MAG2L isoform X1 [Alnus glutinosa]
MEPPVPAHPVLPKHTELSPEQFAFLEEHFRAREDLLVGAPHVLAALNERCADLDADLLHLGRDLANRAVSWISRSFAARTSIHHLNLKIENLSLRCAPHGVGSKVWAEELPQLAKKVRQIEGIHNYVETALRLEALVGDLEDAVFRVMNRHSGTLFSAKDSGPKQEKLLQAIKAMNDIEKLLINIGKFQPQWCNLLKSVDARVDKILGALRPQVFADHRAVLASLGWPPKLLTSKTESIQISGIPNPLGLMQGDKRESYSHSFVALCALQHLQKQREERQFNLLGRKEYNMQLWAIDELVSPIASRMEYHFAKWVDQPEFIFALVYKVTRDFIVGVDDVLQPLIDRARLVSCSAKEAWLSAMIQMLSGFLAKNIFSGLAERYREIHMKSEVMTSWLHLIDLIVAFDKRMQSLVNLETCLFLAESEKYEGLSRGMSVLMIFCDRPDWLKIWAKIELRVACKKLKAELKDERAWIIDNKHGSALHINTNTEQYLLSTREDHKAPSIAESALKISWELIERCQTLPATLPRLQFIRSAAVKFLWYFFEVLLLRFQRTEFPPEYSNDDALIRLCGLINAARYVESKLQEWSDDVEILEMRIAENDSNHHDKDESIDNSCFFVEEIENLSEFETNWLMEIIAVILREFENLSLEYVQNKENFEQELAALTPVRLSATMDLPVSTDFVEALDVLRSQLNVLKTSLNPRDFLDLWRSVAEGLDHFVSCSSLTSKIQFSDCGVSQFETDMQALLCIFQPFCARPQAFFPCIKETLKLLNMNKGEVRHLRVVLSTGENGMKCLHVHGISHLPFDQVDKLLRNRKFGT